MLSPDRTAFAMECTRLDNVGLSNDTQSHPPKKSAMTALHGFPTNRKQELLMPMTIEIYADFICPWCYISLDRLGRLAKERSILVHWNPYLLRPDIAAEGIPLNSILPPERLARAEAAIRELTQAAGLPLNRPALVPNTRHAHEVGKLAEANGLDDAYHQATLRAYFAQARNIGEAEVIAEIGKEVGMDRDEILETLHSGRYRAEIDRFTADAFERGIRSVPNFIFGSGKRFSGALPYEEFLSAVDATR
jgi:predicted DsbA family dithiol-disulfide isomerase